MNKIKFVSRFFRSLFIAALCVLPVATAIAWYYAPTQVPALIPNMRYSAIPLAYQQQALPMLSDTQKLLGFFIASIPMAVTLFILITLIKLFGLYERGKIFTLQHVRYISRIGYALLLGQIANIVSEAAIGVLLTWHNSPGQRVLSVTLDQTNLEVVLIALMVVLVAWIMAEGCKLQEEQQFTI